MQQNTYSPSDSSTWHKRFTKEDLQWDDLARGGKITNPIILLLFLAIIYSIFHVSSSVDINLTGKNSFERIWLIIKLIAPSLIPMLIAGIGFRILFKQAERLIKDFHQLPDDYQLAPLIQRRLFGVPPLPAPLNTTFKYPFILLQEADDLAEDHWARWFGGPATLVIYDGVALYLERGNKFSRVLGPGLPMPVLERYERIKAIVDLRPQVNEML